MSRADLKFLLKVIAVVLLLIAGSVTAVLKLTGPGPVALDCAPVAKTASELYPSVSVAGHPKPAVCELDAGEDRLVVTVSRDDTGSGCQSPLKTEGGEGCLTVVEGSGTPGSNGAEARLLIRDGDLRALVTARMSGATLARAGDHPPVDAYVLAQLTPLARAALKQASD
ncbi:hypothetical protein Afil01_63100 [Actinorhabdospora filicis]|uniref:Uncharacterized protein n=1 Tax=Actinorhabdospora filicis TaxID=1785913 RepID=A0A9W6WCW5_9ACTN|nr:hypothetical protein [Actinorhabdospora filicis]GLZ81503.1 hypothetical protein Afil01_63100 [Actinorhabdospora filicis]